MTHLVESTQKPWASFEEIKDTKFTNFDTVRQKIEELTNKIAGEKKGIVDKPIILNIYSPYCPDMSLIDLPGITRIPLKDSDQPKNIEEITKQIAFKYISDPRTIILCVIPANIDITTSEALQMAKNVDPKGLRTIGVLTKIDIMDKGTNAKKTLLGQEVSLRLGFVGLKLRSQQDILIRKTVQEALLDEANFFAKHPIYSTLSKTFLGTQTLSEKLTKILYTHIKHNLPEISNEIQLRISEVKNRLSDIGPAIPSNLNEKIQIAWEMVFEFCTKYKNAISGKYFSKGDGNNKFCKNFVGGAQIKILYHKLFKEYSKPDYKMSEIYSDSLLNHAILQFSGDNMPGFTSPDVFVALMQPALEKLKPAALELLHSVYNYLENLASCIRTDIFNKFPQLGEEIMEKIIEIMQNEQEKARYLIESILFSEINYMFTNDPDYLYFRSNIIISSVFL